jgi:hypothetical protein
VCLSGIVGQLEEIIQRPHIRKVLCHYSERSKNARSGILEDIYDGEIWQEFQNKQKSSISSTKWFSEGSIRSHFPFFSAFFR